MALMAWLIINPLASEWLEKLNTPVASNDRPAGLDATNRGMRHSIEVLGENFLSMAESIKEDIDVSVLFDPARNVLIYK